MINKLIKYLVNLFTIIYNYQTHLLVLRVRDRFYSFWISKYLNDCDITSNFQYPSFIKGGEYIKVGKNFFAGCRFRIEAWDTYENDKFKPKIQIGDNVAFNPNCHVGCINNITIENNVLIGSNVLITDHSHGKTNLADLNIKPAKRRLYSKGAILIEHDVWIGENSVILPNVIIGHNCVIGANSVVTKSIPPYCIAGGNPAKIIKKNT